MQGLHITVHTKSTDLSTNAWLFKGHLPIPLYKKRTQLASVEENEINRKVDTNGDDNLRRKTT